MTALLSRCGSRTCRCATASPSRRCRASAPPATASRPTRWPTTTPSSRAAASASSSARAPTPTTRTARPMPTSPRSSPTSRSAPGRASPTGSTRRAGACSCSSCTRARSSRATGSRRRRAVGGPALGRKLLGYGGDGPYALPREMTAADIAEAVAGFATGAARARDGRLRRRRGPRRQRLPARPVPDAYTNRRADGYGGSAPTARGCSSRCSTPSTPRRTRLPRRPPHLAAEGQRPRVPLERPARPSCLRGARAGAPRVRPRRQRRRAAGTSHVAPGARA